MVSRPLWMLWPARIVRVNRSIASGSCSSNFCIRRCAHSQNVEHRRETEQPSRTESAGRTGAAEQRQHQEVAHRPASSTLRPKHIGGAVLQVGLFDDGLQSAQHADPGDQIAEEGQLSAMLAAQQFGGACDSGCARARAVHAGAPLSERPMASCSGTRPHVVSRCVHRDRRRARQANQEEAPGPIISPSPRASRGRSDDGRWMP